ncbi:hypothetical protein C4J95_2067 [Pseudomonas orientalis]|uniref:DUF3085 domain-containing protein n=1 Tax=Pseudomonas orientalis TaxID=76758 RepID=UPI000F565705|nr:DUF3085 domain-containing protein [Pseudomonas orientalis]AZE99529.1 hypothetical protein C4J95_2067 [Pseudomonas orientalis]
MSLLFKGSDLKSVLAEAIANQCSIILVKDQGVYRLAERGERQANGRQKLIARNFSPAPVSSQLALTLNSLASLSSCESGMPRENQLVSRWGLIFKNTAKSIGAILHSLNNTRRRTPEHSALTARSVIDSSPVHATFPCS